jgi:hypothetical protein
MPRAEVLALKSEPQRIKLWRVEVDLKGFEPSTSAMRMQRSPS